MISLQSTILWYLFLITVVFAAQRLTRCFSQLNVFSLFFTFLVLMHGVTVPFDDNVNLWFANIYVSDWAKEKYYMALILMWLCVLAGVYLGKLLMGNGVLRADRYRTEIRDSGIPPGMNQAVFLLCCCAIVYLLLRYQVDTSARIGDLFLGKLSAEDYRAMRDNSSKVTSFSLGFANRVASVCRFGILPFAIYISYFMARKGLLWRLLFSALIFMGIIVGVVSGQKSVGLFLIIGLLVAIRLKHGKISLSLSDYRLWAAVLFLWFAVIPFLYRIQYPVTSYAWRLRATTYRLSSEHDRSLQLYFEIYPRVQGFLYGHSSSLINAVTRTDLPVDSLPERFIATYYAGPDYLNTWNASFIGVAWADFGMPGVVAESCLVGMVLQGFAAWFASSRKTALVMGTQVGLIMAATKLSEVALSASLLSFGLLSGFLFYLLLKASCVGNNANDERSVAPEFASS